MPDPFKRPNTANNSPKKQNQPTSHSKKVITTKANSGGNNNNNPPLPSSWLTQNISNNFPDQTASFVEYIRWMRSPDDKATKDATKTQILQLATDRANYDQRLREMERRLTLMVGKDKSTKSCS